MRFASKSLMVALSCALAAPVLAQGKWPERPIRVINPFTPGGTSDLLMRLTTERVEKSLGTQLIIESRPGAGGSIGSAVVAQAPADGYTLLVTTTGPAAIAQVLFEKPPYDVAKDFTYLYMFGGAPILVAVSAKSPIKTIQDFVAAAKKSPQTFANSGTGSVGHLTGALFAGEAGGAVLDRREGVGRTEIERRVERSMPGVGIVGVVDCSRREARAGIFGFRHRCLSFYMVNDCTLAVRKRPLPRIASG